jgi:hypothetical protein
MAYTLLTTNAAAEATVFAVLRRQQAGTSNWQYYKTDEPAGFEAYTEGHTYELALAEDANIPGSYWARPDIQSDQEIVCEFYHTSLAVANFIEKKTLRIPTETTGIDVVLQQTGATPIAIFQDVNGQYLHGMTFEFGNWVNITSHKFTLTESTALKGVYSTNLNSTGVADGELSITVYSSAAVDGDGYPLAANILYRQKLWIENGHVERLYGTAIPVAEAVNEINDQALKIVGLSKENMYIDNTTYGTTGAEAGKMTGCRIRVYASAGFAVDGDTPTEPITTETVTITYNTEGQMESWKSEKAE